MQIAIANAKAQFADLIRKAEAGEPVVITRHGRPVAELRATTPSGPKQLIGAMEGMFEIPDDINWGDAEVEELFNASRIEPE